VPLVLIMLLWMVLLFTLFCKRMPLLVEVPVVLMVFLEMVLPLIFVRRWIPWLSVVSPPVLMVLFSIVLLFALLSRRIPSLLLLPSVVMVFPKMELL